MGDRLGTGVKAIRASEERLAAKGTTDRDVELPARHRTRSWWADGRGRWDRAGCTAGTSCLCHPHLPHTGDRRTLPVGAERPPLGPVRPPTSAWYDHHRGLSQPDAPMKPPKGPGRVPVGPAGEAHEGGEE